MKRTVELAAAPTGTQPGVLRPEGLRRPRAALHAFGHDRSRARSRGLEDPAVLGLPGARARHPQREARPLRGRGGSARSHLPPTTRPGDHDGSARASHRGRAVAGERVRASQLRRRGSGESVERSAAPGGWMVKADWAKGAWQLALQLPSRPQLDARPRLAFAIWRGAARDRGGLKSISPGWIELLRERRGERRPCPARAVAHLEPARPDDLREQAWSALGLPAPMRSESEIWRRSSRNAAAVSSCTRRRSRRRCGAQLDVFRPFRARVEQQTSPCGRPGTTSWFAEHRIAAFLESPVPLSSPPRRRPRVAALPPARSSRSRVAPTPGRSGRSPADRRGRRSSSTTWAAPCAR